MSRIAKFGVLLGLMSCAASNALAVDHWHASAITRIYPQPNGDFVLTFAADHPNCTNASTPDYHYVRVGENGVTADGAKAMYALAIAAASSGRSVTINYSDNTDGCYINRMYVLYP